jgi:hypothetical protein
LISPADAVNSAVMARWSSGKRWRWVVGVALSAVLVYWLSVHRRLLLRALLASSRNVAWHAVHRNNLQLSRTIYTVPLSWYVSSESPSVAFLTATRHVRPTFVSLKDGMEREDIPFESMFTSERDSFAGRGKLIVERRRVRTGFEEDLCLEGTQQILGDAYVVECFGPSGTVSFFSGDRERADSYYNIVKSARLP